MFRLLIFIWLVVMVLVGAIYVMDERSFDVASQEGASATIHPPERSEDLDSDYLKKYVGHSVQECSVIRFTCEKDQEYFSDDKGCGCQTVSVNSIEQILGDPEIYDADFNSEFTLEKNEMAMLPNGDMFYITKFLNQPCPEDVQCIWSGQGVFYALQNEGGEMDYEDSNFPYDVERIDTDFETFATFILNKK